MTAVTVKRKNCGFAKGNVYEGKPFDGVRWVEDKWDGLRGGIIIGTASIPSEAFTLTGLPIPNAQHIVDELVKSGQFAGMMIDGELKGRNWNESSSIVKTLKPHPDALNLNFHVFDMLPLNAWQHQERRDPLIARKCDLRNRLKRSKGLNHVRYTEHVAVKSNDHAMLLALRNEAISRGLEGIMIKDPESVYSFRKNNDWLKWKPVNEDDFVITGAKEGLGKHAGRLGAIKVVGAKDITNKKNLIGYEFEVGGGYDDHEREVLWADFLNGRLIGRILMAEFEIATDIPVRNPEFIRMRTEFDKEGA